MGDHAYDPSNGGGIPASIDAANPNLPAIGPVLGGEQSQ